MNLTNLDIKRLLIFTSILFVFSLYQRKPHVDDAWIGEQAYWMSELGYVKSELMRGITQQEVKNLVHHKFFTLNGALSINILGFSLMSLKLVSLLYLVLFLYFFSSYLREKYSTEWLLGILILVYNSFVFEFSFVYRPEIMVMTFGFLSYVQLEKYLIKSHHYKYLIYAGLLAGLAATSHLNGLIFVICGGLLLLFNKKFLQSIIFGLGSVPTLFIYFYDFRSWADFKFWLYQFNHSPALLYEKITPFSKLLDEHKLFFHSPKEIAFTLLFAFILFTTFPFQKKNKNLLFYLASLIIVLAIISKHNASRYILMYLPYFVIIIVSGITQLKSQIGLTSLKKNVLNSILFIYFIIHGYYHFKTATDKYDPSQLHQLSKTLFGPDTKKLNIIAPMEFIFNEMPYYGCIQSDLGYMDRHRFGEVNTASEMLNIAKKTDIDYILISPEFDRYFKIMDDKTTIEVSNYRLWKQTSEYLILKAR